MNDKTNSKIDFNNLADLQSFKKRLQEIIKNMPEGADKSVKTQLEVQLLKEIDNFVLEAEAKKRKIDLTILYEYEEHYLNLIKNYKEEIKFANSIQEELRKERSKFFSDSLKEVSKTLTETKVDEIVASKWIEELVNSYTQSLDLSNDLVKVNIMDTIGKLRNETSKTIKDQNNEKGETK